MVLFIVCRKAIDGSWKSYYAVQEGEYVTQERIIEDNSGFGHRVLKLTIDTEKEGWPATTELLTE